MSGTFPTAGFSAVNWQSNTVSRITTSVSGITKRLKTGAQYWSFSLKSPALTRANFMSLYSFIVKQDGQFSSFTVVPPVISTTRGTASGTVTVNANTSPGVLTCNVAGGTGTLKKGDLIKFSNHDKVYMLTEDVNLDNSTVDTLTFYPNLTDAITTTTTVDYTNVPITVFLNSDQQSYTANADGTFQYEIAVREDI
jgi:hypothetical protein